MTWRSQACKDVEGVRRASAGVWQEFKQDFGGWNINSTRKDGKLGWLVQDRPQGPCIVGYNMVFDF